jgi:hypothetical protein
MARRRKHRNPSGWSPLMIGLVGVGVYLAYRKWRGLGNGDYGITKPIATRPKPVTVPLKPKPAPSPFWTRAKEVAALPFQTAPAEPVISKRTEEQVFEQINKIARELAGRQPAAAPQYKVMEQVDFSIADEKNVKAATEQARAAAANYVMQSLQKGENVIVPKSQFDQLLTVYVPPPRKRSEQKAKVTLDNMTRAMETEVESVEALASDLRVAQMEVAIESDPQIRASAMKSAIELADLHNSEKKRVAEKIGRMADGYADYLYEDLPDVEEVKARIKPIALKMIARAQESAPQPVYRVPVQPVKPVQPARSSIPSSFTPMQRARATVDVDDDFFGM